VVAATAVHLVRAHLEPLERQTEVVAVVADGTHPVLEGLALSSSSTSLKEI